MSSDNKELKKNIIKAGLVYLVLISAAYFPIVFCNRTLSIASRYPWFRGDKSQELFVESDLPNTFNVDIAHPAAYEEVLDVFIGNQLRKGKIPLWNPFLGCGMTMIGQFSTRLIFPFQMLQNICGWNWRDFFLLFRIFAAAMGVFIFLKVLGLGFYSSLSGGLMFGLSGTMTIMLTLTEMSNNSMILPYLLLFSELLNRKPAFKNVAYLSIATALLILADQPEVSFYALILVVSYYIFRMRAFKDGISGKKRGGCLISSMLLGLIISSPLFIPFLINQGAYYHLHPPGGTMGVQAPTPITNLIGIVFPSFMRWRVPASSFTMNFGWDYLAGYTGAAAVFFILAGFKKKWWGYGTYLFFLIFGTVILLKNIGFPVISWIGYLPVFDQVWTPRWAGPAWNISLVIAAAMGLEAVLCYNKKQPSQNIITPSINSLSLCLGSIAIASGFATSAAIWTFGILPVNILSFAVAIRWLFFVAGLVLIGFAIRKMKYYYIFLCILLYLILAFIEFPFSLLQVGAINIFDISDPFVHLSVLMGMLEAVLAGIGIPFILLLLLNKEYRNIEEKGFIITAVITFELFFNLTLGFDETARAVRLLIYTVLYAVFILYAIKKDNSLKRGRIAFISAVGLILTGYIGSGSLPERDKPFKYPSALSDYDGISRVMGIQGVTFPNSAAIYGIKDIKSIVSTSIERFQLFQDYCLSVIPQGKYKSLWFTGVFDKTTGLDISDNIRERSSYYSLAGISSYLSSQYEELPDTILAEDGVMKRYKNLSVMPRAFIVSDWSFSDSPHSSLDWMLRNPDNFHNKAVIENIYSDIPGLPEEIKEELDYEIEFLDYGLNSVTLKVRSSSAGLLVLTDTFHPEWVARINGIKQRIYPVNLSFRGVFIEPGINKLEFRYEPKSFYIPLFISILTLCGILAAMLISHSVEKHKRFKK